MPKIRLRPAEPADCRRLFDWVNRPESLAGKLATDEKIAWETHEAWFARRLADGFAKIWIVLDETGAAVGQLRLERKGEAFEVDVFIVPGRRGAGVARAALAEALREAAALWPQAPVVARVLPSNRASQALFAACGFRRGPDQADHLVYGRTLMPEEVE